MTEKTLTTENIKPALDALRGELAPWPAVAMKQDRLNDTQKSAVNSGITSGLVAQIIANTAAIRALESAITGTGLRPLVVASLPAIGTQGILYIVPVTTYDPATDADVVNYSNEYIWIVAPDAPVTEGYYEQVGQTGIVINNGQLTIKANNVSVGTFTANQAGDTDVNITIPTNADYVDKTTAQTVAGVKTFSDGIVSRVTGNVTGDLTGTASRAIADEDGTNIKTGYGKLAGANTWTNVNTFLSGAYGSLITLANSGLDLSNGNTGISLNQHMILVTDASKTKAYAKWQSWTNDSEAITLLTASYYPSSSTSLDFSVLVKASPTETALIPYGVTSPQLGTSTNQWSSVYAQTYYYNGTEFSSKFVTTDTYQEITSPKTLLNGIGCKQTAITSTTAPNADIGVSGVNIYDNNNLFWGAFNYAWRSNGSSELLLSLSNWNGNNQGYWEIAYGVSKDFTSSYFRPNSSGYVDLGTSTFKWKTLNGINPGALSFPARDYVSSMDIDTTAWDLTGTTFYYTPLIDGWLQISVSPNNNYAYIAVEYATLRSNSENTTGRNAMLTVPVVANKSYDITIIGSAIAQARLASAQGNV